MGIKPKIASGQKYSSCFDVTGHMWFSYSKSRKLSTAQWPHCGFNDYSGCNDIKPLEYF